MKEICCRGGRLAGRSKVNKILRIQEKSFLQIRDVLRSEGLHSVFADISLDGRVVKISTWR
jgi:hypothetical protein